MPARDLLILAAALLAVHLPFLGQALVIDDGVYVDQAFQILRDPTAPYSFQIHLSMPRDVFHYGSNPPGIAYYLAGAIALFGAGEIALHAACLPLAALAIFATWGLAREVLGEGLYAALLVLAMPAFLVSSHTVMGDVAAAAFYILSLWLLLRGVERHDLRALALCGLAGGLASLFKYSSLTLLPLMLLYPALRGRLRAATLLPLVIMAAIFALWSIASQLIYGEVHFLAASAGQAGASGSPIDRIVQVAATLMGVGAATIFAPILLAWAVHASFAVGRLEGWIATTAAGLSFLAALPAHGAVSAAYDLPNRALGGLLLAAGVSVVVWITICSLRSLRALRGPEPDSACAAQTLLLAACVAAFLLLQIPVLFASARFLIPALPALTLLLIGIGPGLRKGRFSGGRGWRAAALLGTAAIGLALSIVSAAQGAAHRRFVTETVPSLAAGRPIWFTGHWTIRYYARRAGQLPLGRAIRSDLQPKTGDVVYFVPDAVWHQIPQSVGDRLVRVDTKEVSAPLPLLHANQLVGAGYWAHILGVMPFVISTRPLAELDVYQVR
jgi:4-amino-4-deoxy-L-arabinose transferase-like glycosyltransferase